MNTASQILVDKAIAAAKSFEAGGQASFAEAVNAYRDASRWLDEGPETPGEDLDQLHKDLSIAASHLPDWAV